MTTMSNRSPPRTVKILASIVALTVLASLELVSKSLRIDSGGIRSIRLDRGRQLHAYNNDNDNNIADALVKQRRTQSTLIANDSDLQKETLQSTFETPQTRSEDALDEKQRIAKNSVETIFPVQARAFDPWPLDRPLPCFPPDGIMEEHGPVRVPHDRPVSKGFFFTKTFKTGSSTSAGVNLRIARNVARRRHADFDFCNARYDHGKPWMFHGATLFGNRTIGESFLWAILRHPSKRATSLFFHFKVSRFGMEPNDANFIKTMRENNNKKNNYVRTLSLRPFYPAEHEDGIEFANQIIQDYDFIGITERIDESFVALAMILRLPLSDILYLSAKLNGGYDDHCFFIQPTNLTSGMKKYLESDEWTEMIREDLELYKAANRSLDMTIDRLGREQFEYNLAKYKAALKEANERCRERTVFPCTKDGIKVPHVETDCLWSDAGCGAVCLDQVATDLQLDQEFWNPPALQKKQALRIASQ